MVSIAYFVMNIILVVAQEISFVVLINNFAHYKCIGTLS